MKKLIISMLVVFATTSIQQSLRGNNSEVIGTKSIFSFTKNFQTICSYSKLSSTFYKINNLLITGDKKLNIQVKGQDNITASATVKLVSFDGLQNAGPYYLVEGNIYNFYVPDDTWYVEVISKTDNSEVISWYEE